MYMLCCWSRAARPEDQAGQDEPGNERRRTPSPSRRSRSGNNRAISLGARSQGTDAEKFDKAVENNDIAAFVELLDSTQMIEFSEQMHPWAENPRTVGALAGTRLAMLAQAITQKQPIREAGAIPKLVDLLKSEETDRVQTAVVALNFLTAECPENADAVYQAGAMPLLLNCMDAKVAGMRAATATTLRNMCMGNEEYRRRFVELGGLIGLVSQIGCTPEAHANHSDVQLEAVLNLQDMLEAEDSTLIDEYAHIAIKAGVEERLQKLLDAEDEELRAAVEEVLASLAPLSGK